MPIPKLPVLITLILSDPAVEKPNASAAAWNIPVLLFSLKVNEGAVALSLLKERN